MNNDNLVQEKSDGMVMLNIPYASAEEKENYLQLSVKKKNLIASFIPDEGNKIVNIHNAVTQAIEHPVTGDSIDEILNGSKKVTIITENQFRQAPVHEVLEVLLKKIKQHGASASIIIGCGKIPALSQEEILEKLGPDVVQTGVPVYCNDVSYAENYRYQGITSHGIAVSVHKVVDEADVILSVSTTQATLWGYGGSGMIIPAVSDNDTIEFNHIMSLAPDCVPGNNECAMQKDKYEAAKLTGITMGINLIVDNQFNVTYINAGEFESAHKIAIGEYDKHYRFDASQFKDDKADIVITGSSAPTDHLFFHTGWVGMNCWPIVKQGGTIIFTTPCPGYGDWSGFALMDAIKPFMPPSTSNHRNVLKSFYNRESGLWAGCIWYKMYAAMMHADLYIVTMKKNLEEARSYGLTVFESIDEAYNAAIKKEGESAKVAFVPFGRYTILDV